jgi:hypothetical protein
MSPRKTVLLGALAAAFALQVYALYFQLNYGALVGLIPWDDCAVVLRALENIDKFAQAHTLWDILHSARRLDIHAPVSDLQSIVGLLLSGGATWGPYLLNVCGICFAIYAISTTFALRDPVLFAACALLLLLQPITFSALTELKSDWQGGIFAAAALFVLFDSAEANNEKGRMMGASLLSLMLLTKMTAFYMPLLALGVFAAFEFYGALKLKSAAKGMPHLTFEIENKLVWRWRDGVRARVGCVAVILVPYLFFFYYSHGALIAYIRNALGPLFTDGLTIPERLLYYVRGNPWYDYSPAMGTDAPWGGPIYTFVPFLAAALLVAFRRRAWLHILACGGVLAVSATFLVPLALARTSNISFGAPFFGTIIGGTLIAIRIFVANTYGWSPSAVLIATLALALPGHLPLSPPRDLMGSPLGRSEIHNYESIYNDITERIAQLRTSRRPAVVFTFELFVAPYPNLSIRYFRHTGDFLTLNRIDDLNAGDTPTLLAEADFAVTIAPTGGASTVPNVAGNFPTSSDPASGDSRVRGSGRYVLVTRYPMQGAEISLYQAKTSQ